MSELQQKHFDYKIITKYSSRGLQEEVNSHLNKGWKLCGNFTSIETGSLLRFSQTLLIEEDYSVYEARIKKEEEERIALEKRKEEELIAEKKKKEEERIAKEKQKQEKMKQREERKRIEAENRRVQEEKERVYQEQLAKEAERLAEQLAKEAERKANMTEFREYNGFDTAMGRECTVWGPSRFRNGYTIIKGGREDWCCYTQSTFQFPEDETLILTKLPFPKVCPNCLSRLCSKPPLQNHWNYQYVNFFDSFTCNNCGKYAYDVNFKKHYMDGLEWDPEDPDGSKARERKAAEEKAKILAQIAELNAKLSSI